MSEWRRGAIALHEATHAIIAIEVGLPVTWVTIDRGYDEGIVFAAAVKIPDEEIDMDRDREAVCVAMAAPSFFTTGDEEIDRYARIEADLAYQVAGMNGLDPMAVYDRCANLVEDRRTEIVDLADKLEREGTVTFAHA